MKKIIFSIILLWLAHLSISATNIPLKLIKDSLIVFLSKTEDFSPKELSNDMIWNLRIDKPIEERMNGIFLFNIISSHGYSHFLLIDDDRFQIVNMRMPLYKNLEILLKFLTNELYTKDDTIFYISLFVKIYNENKKNNGIPLK